MKSNYKKRLVLIFITLILVGISMIGNIINTNIDNYKIFDFGSLYVLLVCLIISILYTINNKNSLIYLIISLLTYPWALYLIYHTLYLNLLDNPSLKYSYSIFYYIYFISSITLFISLFFKDKEEINNPWAITPPKETKDNNITIDTNLYNKQNLLFTNFISGIKDICYNTTILLYNNPTNDELILIYQDNNLNNKTITYYNKDIKDITYTPKLKMKMENEKADDTETKALLIAYLILDPTAVLIGSPVIKSLINTLTNNYDKVDYNEYFEITIFLNNNTNIILSTDNNPEEFINNFKHLTK